MEQAARAGRMTRNERLVVGYTALAHGLNHTPEWVYAAVLVQVGATFGLGEFALGSIGTVFAVGYGLTALPAGWLSDFIGSKRTLVFSLAASGLVCLMVAGSPNTATLAVAMTLLGLAAGMYHPVGIAFITRSVQRRAQALGYHGVAGNAGMALAPALAGWVAVLIHWRAAFVVFAAAFLVAAALTAASRVEESHDPRPQGEATPGEPQAWASLRPLLVFLLLVIAINVLYGFIYRGVTIFLPTHIQNNVPTSFLGIEAVAIAGSLTTIALLFGSLGQYIGGHLGERLPREKLLIPLAALVIPLLVLTAFATGALLIVVVALFVFINFMAQPTYASLVADYSPRHLRGRMYGVTFLAIFVLGALAGVVTGYVAQRHTTDWAFVTLAAVGVVAVGVSLALAGLAGRRPRRLGMEEGEGPGRQQA